MDKYQIAIVIPAFNEEATIFNVVQSVKKYGAVIVVDASGVGAAFVVTLKALDFFACHVQFEPFLASHDVTT